MMGDASRRSDNKEETDPPPFTSSAFLTWVCLDWSLTLHLSRSTTKWVVWGFVVSVGLTKLLARRCAGAGLCVQKHAAFFFLAPQVGELRGDGPSSRLLCHLTMVTQDLKLSNKSVTLFILSRS
jgi:hypothetical protein